MVLNMAKRKGLGDVVEPVIGYNEDLSAVADKVSKKLHGENILEESKRPLAKLTARIDDELHHQLKVHCAVNKTTIQEVVESALRAHIGKE